MKGMVLLSAILVLGTVFSACSTKSTPPEKPVSKELITQETKSISKEAWEIEWEKAVKEGKRDGKVVIYTTWASESRAALGSAFKNKYGIEAEFITGRGAELRARLFSERRAGLYTADFFLMGASGMIFDLKPFAALDPLDSLLMLPEVLDPKAWWGGKLNWIDEQRHVYGFFAIAQGRFAINTSIVKTEDIKYWHDLLLPKWKGKITINDPTTTGSGNLWFTVIVKHLFNLDYMRELVKQEPILLRDLRLQMDWLAGGKYPIAIGYSKDLLGEFIRAGAPILEKVTLDEDYVSQGIGSISLVNRAPHPNAAKVFINWLLSKEGQELATRITNYQTARTDVPIDFLSPEMVRKEGVKYFDTRDEKFQIEQGKQLEVAKEIFSPLLKR